MEKLLSIAIPCFNSEAYMRHAIETLLPGGDEVEILIVDDGSKDGTAAIADEYEKKYPDIVRALHKANGGHGDAVMCGLDHASGIYFKVVDSDDWVDETVYPKVLSALRCLSAPEEQVDLFLCDYIYDKVGQEHKHVVRYANVLPVRRVFGWEDVGRFHMGQYILMHSAIYRTGLLRDSGMRLPKHTFYVDNLYVYEPLPFVSRMFYLDEVFYHYYIGREDQSVQEGIMIRRIDQQLTVNRIMLSNVNLSKVTPKEKQRYMFSYLEIITAVSSILLIRSGTEENLRKKKELWQFIRGENLKVYRKLRFRPMGLVLNLPGKIGRMITYGVYSFARKKYGFN